MVCLQALAYPFYRTTTLFGASPMYSLMVRGWLDLSFRSPVTGLPRGRTTPILGGGGSLHGGVLACLDKYGDRKLGYIRGPPDMCPKA